MRTVTSATAAAPVRLVATAFVVASVLAFLVVGRADGAERAWSVVPGAGERVPCGDDASALGRRADARDRAAS